MQRRNTAKKLQHRAKKNYGILQGVHEIKASHTSEIKKEKPMRAEGGSLEKHNIRKIKLLQIQRKSQ